MNGVTGRMGRGQHLARSVLAIRADGGRPLPDGTTLWPEPVLVGREVRYRVLGAELSATARRLEAIGTAWERRLLDIKAIAEDL